ncbi:hypothetical protein AMATHDRAFT_171409 [Amanita thiersii Skay4041]|uniref:Major facilitator superfamily (MFS) profile domain-containing protein n=1 Tax=Amanita thiersii Skay4041 TaxID=703135 RepID=A0A2A9NVV9_9AGAR|nr:hypothetical protein AMATHDRAFT_171409 [Amanita thiersii Skay4041]
MSSEETPLLHSTLVQDSEESAIRKHQAIYEFFSPTRKRILVLLVSSCGLLPLFVSGTLFPVIPQIAKDLNTTGSVISLAVSVSIFGASFGGLCAASYSTFYGRRPVYLVSLPLLFVGSLGVSTATSVPQLMFWRFVQASGASPGMTVGAGVIGDLYRLEERGGAMGVFLAACLIGPALAPPIGGFVAHYTSWRVMQFLLGVLGLCGLILMSLCFPETSHPGARGIDKLQPDERQSWKSLFVNPFSPLELLRSPNLLSVSLAGFAVLLTDYVLLVPLPFTIAARYNITNEGLIGACFIPAGLGNLIGAPLAGRISDKIVVKWRERRGGIWYPEDRLRATLPGALFFVPLSILLSGLITHFVSGRIGLILNLVCLFANGIGVDIVLSPSVSYTVDVLHSRSAEAMAANSCFRALLLSLTVTIIIPLIEKYGVAITDGLFAAFAWVGFIILWLTIKYGGQMRAWVDVGYSTASSN